MTTIGSSTSVNPMPAMHVRGGGGHGGKGLLSTDTDTTTDPFTDSLTAATSTTADATTTAAATAATATTAASALNSTVAAQLQNLLGIA
jgi:protease II